MTPRRTASVLLVQCPIRTPTAPATSFPVQAKKRNSPSVMVDDDPYDDQIWMDDDELPLWKRAVIMLARLCRTLLLELLKGAKFVFLTSLVAIISASFILAQKAAVSSARAVSNAIIDVVAFVFKSSFSSLLLLFATRKDKTGKRKNEREKEEEDDNDGRLQ